MARYIDADEAKNLFCGRCTTPKRHGVTVEQCRAEEKESPRYRHKWCLIMRLIDQAETADVTEVKHGEWIECSNELNKYCSVCKKVHGTIYEKPPFCENCGAKMAK